MVEFKNENISIFQNFKTSLRVSEYFQEEEHFVSALSKLKTVKCDLRIPTQGHI